MGCGSSKSEVTTATTFLKTEEYESLREKLAYGHTRAEGRKRDELWKKIDTDKSGSANYPELEKNLMRELHLEKVMPIAKLSHIIVRAYNTTIAQRPEDWEETRRRNNPHLFGGGRKASWDEAYYMNLLKSAEDQSNPLMSKLVNSSSHDEEGDDGRRGGGRSRLQQQQHGKGLSSGVVSGTTSPRPSPKEEALLPKNRSNDGPPPHRNPLSPNGYNNWIGTVEQREQRTTVEIAKQQRLLSPHRRLAPAPAVVPTFVEIVSNVDSDDEVKYDYHNNNNNTQKTSGSSNAGAVTAMTRAALPTMRALSPGDLHSQGGQQQQRSAAASPKLFTPREQSLHRDGGRGGGGGGDVSPTSNYVHGIGGRSRSGSPSAAAFSGGGGGGGRSPTAHANASRGHSPLFLSASASKQNGGLPSTSGRMSPGGGGMGGFYPQQQQQYFSQSAAAQKERHSYLQREEFRVFLLLVGDFLELYFAFGAVEAGAVSSHQQRKNRNGGGGSDHHHGRTISLAEFRKAIPMLRRWGIPVDDMGAGKESEGATTTENNDSGSISNKNTNNGRRQPNGNGNQKEARSAVSSKVSIIDSVFAELAQGKLTLTFRAFSEWAVHEHLAVVGGGADIRGRGDAEAK